MDIGKPQRVITIEPIEDPVPREQPAPEPEREPVREPERVGADSLAVALAYHPRLFSPHAVIIGAA
jgi:hypothetical protein